MFKSYEASTLECGGIEGTERIERMSLRDPRKLLAAEG